MYLGLYVGNFFLIGDESILCKIESVFEKQCIPHWCSYSSEQQYLSASIAGILWCGKVLFVVLNCKIILFIQKCIFEQYSINSDIFPVPYFLWRFRAESVLEDVYHIGVHIAHSNNTF